jgi:colanic acid/amylovoran biosynthesis glycosyltransferase
MGVSTSQYNVFVQRRLQALASANMHVIAPMTIQNPQLSASSLDGMEIIWLQKHQNPFHYLKGWGIFMIRHPLKSIRLLRALLVNTRSVREFLILSNTALQLADLTPDVIHFEWNSGAISHEWMFDYFHCPAVISCRGRQVNIWPHMPGKENFTEGLKRTFRKTTAVHCVSQAILQECVELGLDPQKGNVIYTAVDTEFYAPRPDKKSDPSIHIIMVGALIWRKGFEYALMALKTLREQNLDVYLDIVGDGAEKDRIEYTARDLKILERVNLLGKLSSEQVRNALWKADIFLLASLSEGIANVVVEAMSCGLPVVSTDCGGMQEAITDGVEGFLVPARDADAIAVALARLTTDPNLRAGMGAAGRKRAVQMFTFTLQGKKFSDLYQRLATQQ